QEKEPSKPKGSEKKPLPQGNNILWYLLGLGVLLLLLVTVWSATDKLTIQWSDLETLIKASNPKAADHTVVVHNNTVKPPVEYVLSDPQEIRIGGTEVTGTVDSRERKIGGGEHETLLDKAFAQKKRIPFRVASNLPATERILGLLAENDIKDYSNEEQPSQLLSYLPVLVLTGMFVLLMIVMLRRMGGAGSPMAFGRSRGKLYAQEDIEVTFDDVAGIDEAV